MTEQEKKWLNQDIKNYSVFAEKYLKIKTKDGRIIPFKFNSAQIKVNKIVEDAIKEGKPQKFIILKARQEGISTYFAGRIFWRNITHKFWKAAVVGHVKDASNNLFDMIKRFWEYLDELLQPSIQASNEKKLSFSKLKSEMKVFTAEGGDSVGRSDNFQDLHLTETAFWRDAKSVLTALLQTVGDIKDSLQAIESTANGVGGDFYERWQAAKNGESEYIPIFLAWFELDDYKREFLTEDEKNRFIKSLSEKEQDRIKTYNLSLEQANWYRHTLMNKCGGDEMMMAQEYPCLVGGTLIQTTKGLQRIDEAYVDGTIVKEFFKQGEKQCYLLKTKLGYEVEATDNHRFLTDNGFIELKDLQIGDKVKLANYEFNKIEQIIKYNSVKFTETSIHIDAGLAEFIGLYMGDGDFGDNTVGISCDRECQDLVDIVKSIFTYLFGGYSERFSGTKMGCDYIRKSNVKFTEIFDKLELIKPKKPKDNGWSNGYKRWVHVPSYILSSPHWVVSAFLRGLFEADGFADKNGNRIILFSKHREFLKQIQVLLLGFGITSKFNEIEKKAGNGNVYIGYELALRKEESRLFGVKIGFLSNKKNSRILNQNGDTYNQLPYKLEDEIVSIEATDIKTVYDVETYNHEVIANGIVTHNCNDIEAFVASGRPVFDTKICLQNYELSKRAKPRIGNIELRNGKYEFIDNERGFIKLFYDPELKENEKHRFAAGCDVAEGLEQGDFSVISVLDRRKMEVILEWHGHIDPDLLADEQEKIYHFLNKDVYFCTERNNHGLTTIVGAYKKKLKQYYNQTFTKGYASSSSELGFKTSAQSKVIVINNLNEWIREQIFGSDSTGFWSECLTFVKNAKGQMQAQGKDEDKATKCFDDRVISNALMINCSLWMPNLTLEQPKEPVSRPFFEDEILVDEATF